ncbi:MAG: repressor LexA [Spirochaetes bacterium GWD1_61_31]|nr:MAG: repressor LexA [Spirochaetes bacterium GWB1_60_80]OHD31299.1 MAG: repressor LexA [Spirochaetes bacterium GWC1_61_12]OHD39485.1 MAG: repressor LexA [Spirochaetes bacterium GWD1_61_31]OHD45537.1 MAG: repressor LexA [Spirochaetes bacterium GWE1_60_18]OHD58110.1 MAG: repressor LexA [Spirochaetes bacterium GWF1_60_12]HAP44682.1 repressor LexA [Spirochaetaceae bacterium]
MKPLTERQQKVLTFIEGYIKAKPYPPTMREIAEHFCISVKGAYDHVKALERKGCIKSGQHRSRTMELVGKNCDENGTVQVPLLGEVAAGKPIFADDSVRDCIAVPSSMVGSRSCFALRVRGDSMINAGILDGDTAIIEEKATAVNGDIIVAMLEDSVTLKRFFKEKDRIRLAPENPAFSPIFTQDLRILGKLRGIIRSY